MYDQFGDPLSITKPLNMRSRCRATFILYHADERPQAVSHTQVALCSLSKSVYDQYGAIPPAALWGPIAYYTLDTQVRQIPAS